MAMLDIEYRFSDAPIEGTKIRHKTTKDMEFYIRGLVFCDSRTSTVMASGEEVAGFDRYIERYKDILGIERKALEVFNA